MNIKQLQQELAASQKEQQEVKAQLNNILEEMEVAKSEGNNGLYNELDLRAYDLEEYLMDITYNNEARQEKLNLLQQQNTKGDGLNMNDLLQKKENILKELEVLESRLYDAEMSLERAIEGDRGETVVFIYNDLVSSLKAEAEEVAAELFKANEEIRVALNEEAEEEAKAEEALLQERLEGLKEEEAVLSNKQRKLLRAERELRESYEAMTQHGDDLPILKKISSTFYQVREEISSNYLKLLAVRKEVKKVTYKLN